MMSELIEFKDITFGYRNKPILDRVSFSLSKGDFAALTGANGAGKSTILKLILGELTPAAGWIRLMGEDVRQFKNWPKIGYVPQKSILSGGSFPATAEEIVLASLYAQIGRMRFAKKEHREKARQALAQVGLEQASGQLIGNLSGGQQQRVMITRVLVSEPNLMLLDEPTTGLDSTTVQGLYELLARLNQERGLTILMVTHDLARASDYVNRIFCLEEESLLELGKSQILEEISHKHKHPAKHADAIQTGEEVQPHGHSAI
jgi:zinc transport system ATP-binding protein